MIFRLFNGAKTKEAWNPESPEFIDDLKPEELSISCDIVQVTYRDHIKVHVSRDISPTGILDFYWEDDRFIEHEGVFYGDFVVED